MSALAPSTGFRVRVPLTLKNVTWAIMGLMTIVVFANDAALLNPHHPYRSYENKVAWVLLPHLLPGLVALLAGPLQFSSRFRKRYPDVHRKIGRTYVGCVLVSAPFALLIPFVGPKDPFFTIGVICHASVWFTATLMAFLTARSRLMVDHKRWMMKSYALTFSFVLIRVLGPVWHLITIQQYGVADVIMSFSYILIGDVIFAAQDMSARKNAGAARRAATPA
jgi:hypothetical protein